MYDYEKEMEALRQKLERQDNQLEAIWRAEEDYKDDINSLIVFWENLLKTDGLLFNGSRWSFRIVELYYKAERYDDAWRELNRLTLDPTYRSKARKWQIRILKKEKKDYSQVQRLLDSDL